MTTGDRNPRTPDPRSTGGGDTSPTYEIRVAGRLGSRWSSWFDGWTVEPAPDGTTAIRGPVPDQSALHGVLRKLADVGLTLVSLHPVPSVPSGEPAARPPEEEH